MSLQRLFCFHPEMVFFAHLGVHLHVCLCGDHQVASAQTLDFLDMGKKSSFPDRKLGCTGKSFPVCFHQESGFFARREAVGMTAQRL
ncbi:hypothetical protein TRIP_B170017 [uncultured Desulfatiglans sp.]|uniref:Uncharacterized protein n=1 Tax=Uncultured Desulfatiglans sp. TaxID=1748965 RepID=A0A653A111_UNCDX|nr:hypothetical protein TRIP_B170017 [uncultured Desulfatiglans sp.]